MKSEHRHHLAENDLEHRLGELAEKLKPYAKHILFGTLALSVIVIIAVVVFNNMSAEDRYAWAEFTACQNASQYEEVALKYPDSTVAQWAWIHAGEMQLQNGVQLSFTSRTVAVDNLEDAQKAFEEVLNNPDAIPETRERALNGLGRTLETLSETQAAIEAYQQLVDDFPESRFKLWADSRIAELGRPDTQEFYAWYQEQNPDPADRPDPADLFGDDDEFHVPVLPNLPESSVTPDAGDDTPPPPPDSEGADGDSEATDADTDAATDGPNLGPPTGAYESTSDESTTTPADADAEATESDAPEGTEAPPADADASAAEGDATDDADEASTPDADATSEPATSDGESTEGADPPQ